MKQLDTTKKLKKSSHICQPIHGYKYPPRCTCGRFVKIIPIKIESFKLVPSRRKLSPEWKCYTCPKCFELTIYKGRKPTCSNCRAKIERSWGFEII